VLGYGSGLATSCIDSVLISFGDIPNHSGASPYQVRLDLLDSVN
jgi:hypothetical protein